MLCGEIVNSYVKILGARWDFYLIICKQEIITFNKTILGNLETRVVYEALPHAWSRHCPLRTWLTLSLPGCIRGSRTQTYAVASGVLLNHPFLLAVWSGDTSKETSSGLGILPFANLQESSNSLLAGQCGLNLFCPCCVVSSCCSYLLVCIKIQYCIICVIVFIHSVRTGTKICHYQTEKYIVKVVYFGRENLTPLNKRK